jgi:outer membrane PBP1 activator LpoA protein
VGPLIRQAVTAIAAGDVSIPTLALNAPDGNVPNRPNLHAEPANRNGSTPAARPAFREPSQRVYRHRRQSIVERLHAAFNDEFAKQVAILSPNSPTTPVLRNSRGSSRRLSCAWRIWCF